MVKLSEASKKYKRKYKCSRCNASFKEKKDKKRHMEWLHGDYGASERPYKKQNKHILDVKTENEKLFLGEMGVINSDFKFPIKYKWDKKTKTYRIFTDATKYGKDIEIIFDRKVQKYNIKDREKLELEISEKTSKTK